MASSKQTKKLYKRIRYHMYQLQKALNDAHEKRVIEYDSTKFNETAPCFAMKMLRDRVEKTTLHSRAQAFKDDAMNELKGVW